VLYVKDFKGSDETFVFYFLQTFDFASFNAGSAVPTLNRNHIHEIPVKIPLLPEQRAIAGVLSRLDDKIDLLHRQNKTLEGITEALWRKMFVEAADPGWKKGKLGDMIITIESGRRPKGGIDPGLQFGIPSIGAENIIGIGNYEHNKTKYVSEEFYYKMNSGKVQDYDILIYKDGAYIGRKSMFARGFPFKQCCVNEHVFILRTKDINTQIFLYFLLDQEELEQLNANSAQPGLNQESMKSFEIFIPDEKYIEKFGIETKAIIDKIFFNSIQIRTLSKMRDALLPKLMSGEIRIKNAEKL
jgi:type I restriction enzyme S subunit